MAFGVRAYVVDVRKMTDAIGSRNARLPAAIIESCADMIEDFDYLLCDGEETAGDKHGSLATMIDILISGDFERLDDAEGLGNAALGYALECLAAYLSGGPLQTNALDDIGGEWLREQPVLGELAGRPGPLAGLIPLPEDFPAICVIDKNDVRATLLAAQRARDANLDPSSRACHDELIVWLETAQAEGNGLVTFCY